MAPALSHWSRVPILLGSLLLYAVPGASAIGHAESALLMPRADQSLLLDVAEAGQNLVAVGERGHILLSKDKGESWRQVPAPSRQMLTAVDFIDASRGWAVGHDGIVLATMDGGESWVKYSE